MNDAKFLGRLTADVDLKKSETTTYVRFTIAVNRRRRSKENPQADFIHCVAWNGTAEAIAKYFCKGSLILVSGEMHSSTWKNEDGKENYALECDVDQFFFTGERSKTAETE